MPRDQLRITSLANTHDATFIQVGWVIHIVVVGHDLESWEQQSPELNQIKPRLPDAFDIMRPTTFFFILHSWHILVLAQQRANVDNWGIGAIGFATPGEYECADIESRPEYVWLGLFSNITSPGCYDLEEVFSQQSCNPNDADCPFSFRAFNQENFSAAANYSRVFSVFAEPPQSVTSEVDLTELTLEVYDGANCAQEEYPPYQWSGCEDSNEECTDLPFGVVSFYVTGSENANRTGDCLVGVVQGSEATRKGVLLGVVMIVTAVVGVVVV